MKINTIYRIIAVASALVLSLSSSIALAQPGKSAGKGQGIYNSIGHPDVGHPGKGKGHTEYKGNGYGHNEVSTCMAGATVFVQFNPTANPGVTQPLLTAGGQLVASAMLYSGEYDSLEVKVFNPITGYGVYSASLINEETGALLTSWGSATGAATANFGDVYGPVTNYSVVAEVCPMAPVTDNPDGGGNGEDPGNGTPE